jgi:hypothetical protein
MEVENSNVKFSCEGAHLLGKDVLGRRVNEWKYTCPCLIHVCCCDDVNTRVFHFDLALLNLSLM